MSISEVQITPVKPSNGLIAFASVVLDKKIYLGSIAVYRRLDGTGFRITYPSKKVGDRNIQIYHPITRTMGWEIEIAITQKAKNIFK